MSVSTLIRIYSPENFRPQKRKFQGTNIPGNESSSFRSRGRKFQHSYSTVQKLALVTGCFALGVTN